MDEDLFLFSGGDTPHEMTGLQPAKVDESAFHEALDHDPTDRDLRNQYATWLENEKGREHEARGQRFMAHHGLSPEPRTDYNDPTKPTVWAWAVGDFWAGPRRKVYDKMTGNPPDHNIYWKRFPSRQEAEHALHQAVYEVEKTGKRLL